MVSLKFIRRLLIVYVICLTWGILFKFGAPIAFTSYRYINWVPFAEPLIINGQVVWLEVAFNLVAFIPFGLLLKLTKPRWAVTKVMTLGFLLSLSYEALQWLLAIGMSDVTDLLMNTAGVAVGSLLAIFLERTLCKKN
ncbi:VanZ family protein [Streptococcus entericus]|uniref:VanZ family protein n=1 Tax=Streptococcus entericus TaxID=155680 RepID=UPI00036B252F|nr:VanZ family protein [Streptococcus entericus]